MLEKNKNYVVISTIKNEWDNFFAQIIMLEKQDIKPIAWYIIVDDDQLDKYQYLVDTIHHSFPIYLSEIKNKTNINYYKRLAHNLDNLIKNINLEHFNQAQYLMKLDGDILIPYDYTYILLNELNNEKDIYVISGGIKTIGVKDPKRYNDFPLGAAMLFHKDIVNYWKGYPKYPASDTVLSLTALLLKKRVKMCDKTIMTQVRNTSSRVGYNPTLSTAIKHYYLRYPLGLTILYILKEKPTSLFKFIIWYLKNKKNAERLNDPNIIRINLERLSKHKLAKLYFKVFGGRKK